MDVNFWDVFWAAMAPVLLVGLAEAIVFAIISIAVIIAIWWTHKY